MGYGVYVHFSLPPNCLLCTGALSAHEWSIVLISRGVQLAQPYLTLCSLKLLVLLTFPSSNRLLLML